MGSNAFDEILGLEERFYNDGYRQGMTDGVNAGRIEGRTFGLEKGFEKYIESGKLYGKSLVWANRIPQLHEKPKNGATSQELSPPGSTTPHRLPALPDNQRLVKHLNVLHALSEAETLSTENTEEAVSDFDDRYKRAQAKAKIIERLVGESKGDSADNSGNFARNSNIEDASIRNTIQ